MFDLESVLRQQLRECMASKQTLIFPEGDDPRIVCAASKLLKFANIVLVGSRSKAEDMVTSGEAVLECARRRFFTMVRWIDPREDPLTPELAEHLYQVSQGKKWEVSLAEAEALVREPVHYSIMAVRAGYADAVLGGVTYSTRDFFLPCLRILERDGTVYEMALFALPDSHGQGIFEKNLVMFSDVALNPAPSPEALADIAIGACRTMRDIIPVSQLPEINGALLSYSTRGSGEGPSVERIRQAEPIISERLLAIRAANPLYESVNIVTEMQISVAVSDQAARTKLKDEYHRLKGAGRANVLIVPTLDVGNLLYHIYSTRYPTSKTVLVIGGLHNQALDFSRSSTAEEVALGAKALLLRRFKSDTYCRTPKDFWFPRFRILTINPGSTSTKVALFEGEDLLASTSISHSMAEMDGAGPRIIDQLPMRRQVVESFLSAHGLSPKDLHAVVGRGGLLRPIESGTFTVCDQIVADLREGVSGDHPSNLGGLIAREIADKAGLPAFTVDPPVVDELDALSRITGLKESEQEAAWHALSQKAAAKHWAESHNREYDELDLIVAHLGGGISVGSHRQGRCVKVKNALYDGPMSPNRAGSLPGGDLITLCYSGMSREDLTRRIVKQGGLLSYLGTDDLREVEGRVQSGDSEAATIFDAMCEQIAAEIASHLPKFQGDPVDQIIITGGMCHSELLRSRLSRDLSPLGVKITFYPGEREMEALRDGALRVLRGMEQAKPYAPLREIL
ncbi:MAG: butyrate kinase [Polyangia bacterium]|jgi:butyrate kinase|nr:butyrate kinase [Polyangia bacterium]